MCLRRTSRTTSASRAIEQVKHCSPGSTAKGASSFKNIGTTLSMLEKGEDFTALDCIVLEVLQRLFEGGGNQLGSVEESSGST